MKVKSVHIKSLKQFQDLKLDLTYPKGHEKAGEALEKVCFIGQSGTGKTNLISYILKGALLGNPDESDMELSGKESISLEFFANDDEQRIIIAKKCQRLKTQYDYLPSVNLRSSKLTRKEADSLLINAAKFGSRYVSELRERFHLYYFSAQADLPISKEFYKSISDKASHIPLSEQLASPEININDLFLNQVIYSHQESLGLVSNAIGNEIAAYKSAENLARIDATYQAEADPDFNVRLHMEKWRKHNPSPIERLFRAKLFDLLRELNVQSELAGTDGENIFNSAFRVGKAKQNITFSELSSGIRHLINLMLPLIVRNPNNAIVFVDEPETSLFPDVQKKFISMFTSIGENNQYFFATHSPIIAAAFEPEERFFLYFDDEGSVNYSVGIAPEGDDSNDLLVKDFKLESPFGEKGDEMHEHYIRLRMRIEAERNPARKDDLMHEFMQLGMKYGF